MRAQDRGFLKRTHPAGEQWSYSSGAHGYWGCGGAATGMPLCRMAGAGPCGSPPEWRMTASGTLISRVNMTSGRMALTPRWKTGSFLASLSPDGRPANGQRRCLKAGLIQSSARLRRRNQSPGTPGRHFYGYQWWNNAIPGQRAATSTYRSPGAERSAVGAGYLRPCDYGQPCANIW